MTRSVDSPSPGCSRLLALAERAPHLAEPLARHALETLPPDDPAAQAWGRYALGWALLCWERVEAARPLLQDAYEGFAANQAQRGRLYCRYALLLADKMQGTGPDLERDLAALADEFERARLPLDGARARLEQARHVLILGRPRDAEAILERTAAVFEHGEPLDRARLAFVQGIVATARSNYALAARLLAQAEQGFARLRNRRERARCLMEQGWLALRQEELDLALSAYQRAEQMFLRLDMPLLRAFCSRDIGLLMSMRGAYDVALRQTLAALRTFERYGRYRDQAGCRLHMGNIYFYTGRWAAALACYARAEAMYAAGGAIGYCLVAQRNRAMVYRAQGARAEARALLDAVEREAQAIGNQAEVAEIWSIQAALLADEERDDEARQLYRRAQDLFARLENTPAAMECVLEQGWLAFHAGALETAAGLFHLAAPALARHPHHLWRVDYGLAQCLRAHGAVDQALRHYRDAIGVVAGLRQRLANEEISSSLHRLAMQLHSDALRLAADSGAIEPLIEISENQRALVLRRLLAQHLAPLPDEYQAAHDLLRQQIIALMAESDQNRDMLAPELDLALTEYAELLLRARHDHRYEPEPSPAPLEITFDLADVRAHLIATYGDDWTALVYIVNDATLLIGIVTPQGVDLDQTPYDASLLRLLKHASHPSFRLYTYCDHPYHDGKTTRRWHGLRALAERLLPPAVQSRLHPAHRLLIVPSGPLHTLPWPALRVAEKWLVETAVPQLLPSLSAWRALQARSPSSSAAALLVGCGAIGERAAALPTVAAELAAIAEIWPGPCDQLVESQASRAALLARSAGGDLARYGLLHIASHAQLLSSGGLAAHVKLWDGDLLLPEVVGLRLDGALVTLSVCRGAATDVLPGEEILSLSWAFLAAGARGVMASVWPIPDQVAFQFMSQFYAALRHSQDAALALTVVQRTFISAHRLNDDPLGQPLYWSNFVFTG